MHLVAGHVSLSSSVVAADSSWVLERFEVRTMVRLVLQEVLDIVFGEVSRQTFLHIVNFLLLDDVVVVHGGLIDESLIEHGVEQQIEVGHESSIVTVLVLREDHGQH